MPRNLLFIAIALLLPACAGARSDWPTVSFGNDLKAFDAEAAGNGVVLAPLPILSAAEREGIGTPEPYFAKLAADFSDLKERLQKRLAAFRAAEAAFAASQGAADDLKLGAELELSNLSLTVAELPAIRARAALARDAAPQSAGPAGLITEAEALEAAFRALINGARLPARGPASG